MTDFENDREEEDTADEEKKGAKEKEKSCLSRGKVREPKERGKRVRECEGMGLENTLK